MRFPGECCFQVIYFGLNIFFVFTVGFPAPAAR